MDTTTTACTSKYNRNNIATILKVLVFYLFSIDLGVYKLKRRWTLARLTALIKTRVDIETSDNLKFYRRSV